MDYYFAYGSNLNFTQMSERCPSSKPLEAAFLYNYSLEFDEYSSRWGGGAATITNKPDAKTAGGLFEVSPEDEKALDHYEGLASVYEKIEVEVQAITSGKNYSAFTYIKPLKYSFPPSLSYLLKIMKGYFNFNIDFSFLNPTLIKSNFSGKAIFVYGTLKQGQAQHSMVGKPSFIIKSQLQGELYSLPEGYPCFCNGENIALGEILLYGNDISHLLEEVDSYENYSSKKENSLFLRKINLFSIENSRKNTLIPAWYYQASNKLEKYAKEKGKLLPSGDWN